MILPQELVNNEKLNWRFCFELWIQSPPSNYKSIFNKIQKFINELTNFNRENCTRNRKLQCIVQEAFKVSAEISRNYAAVYDALQVAK